MKIEQEIFKLLDQRAEGKTICPSEVARSLWPNAWRDHMDDVREVATQLVRRKKLLITQKGQAIDPDRIHGPIRLAKFKSD